MLSVRGESTRSPVAYFQRESQRRNNQNHVQTDSTEENRTPNTGTLTHLAFSSRQLYKRQADSTSPPSSGEPIAAGSFRDEGNVNERSYETITHLS